MLASVRDPALERLAAARGNVDEVYDAAAAEQAMVRRRRTAELLRALGVDVVDADAERLPPGPRRPLPHAQGQRPAVTT